MGARLPDDRLRWSFRLYDMDNSGSIALNEMEGVFDCIYNMFEVWSTVLIIPNNLLFMMPGPGSETQRGPQGEGGRAVQED